MIKTQNTWCNSKHVLKVLEPHAQIWAIFREAYDVNYYFSSVCMQISCFQGLCCFFDLDLKQVNID